MKQKGEKERKRKGEEGEMRRHDKRPEGGGGGMEKSVMFQ